MRSEPCPDLVVSEERQCRLKSRPCPSPSSVRELCVPPVPPPDGQSSQNGPYPGALKGLFPAPRAPLDVTPAGLGGHERLSASEATTQGRGPAKGVARAGEKQAEWLWLGPWAPEGAWGSRLPSSVTATSSRSLPRADEGGSETRG